MNVAAQTLDIYIALHLSHYFKSKVLSALVLVNGLQNHVLSLFNVTQKLG